MTDMNHMNYIRAIALGDVAVLEKKEATYKGSWKKSGGRSAWFMVKRMLDRLGNMLAPYTALVPQEVMDTEKKLVTLSYAQFEDLQKQMRSEDIFEAIESEPSGADGTVLAVIRDTRRYLMLVEAEMVSRGLVQVEGREEGAFVDHLMKSSLDLYALAAQLLSVSRPEAKARVHKVLYGEDPEEQVQLPQGTMLTNTRRAGESDEQAAQRTDRRDRFADETDQANPPDTPSCGDGTFDKRMQRKAEDEAEREADVEAGRVQRTPEDGGQHANLTPWAVSLQWRHRKGYAPVHEDARTFDKWWKQQARGLWVLEAAVPLDAGYLPAIIAHLYETVGEFRVILVASCPADAREWFPTLRKEINSKEREGLPTWQQGMYRWNETGSKWIIEPQHAAWTKD